MPITKNDRVKGFITYYIGDDDEDKYVRDDPWSIVEDDPKGNTCYIDQLITDKQPGNAKYSYQVFKEFKNHIRKCFPNVKYIRWNRVKNGGVNVHKRF